jgi:hypothetical protein
MRDLQPAVLLILGAVSVAALAALYVAPAAAQTPDGLPPALETVCDMESGAAFGWCNAYCEAMDCDLANDNDPATEPKASATACSKVRTKFQQQTGRDMPCEVSCPCTDNPEAFPVWAAYLAGDATGDYCLLDGNFCELNTDEPPSACIPPQGDITYIEVTYSLLGSGNPASQFGFVAASSLGLNSGVEPPFCADSVGGVLPVSSAQGAVCKEQLEAALAASGLVCSGPPV